MKSQMWQGDKQLNLTPRVTSSTNSARLSSQRTDQPQGVLELYRIVQNEAVKTYKKSAVSELTLMELLNTFDKVVAHDNFKSRALSPPTTPNGNEIHNQVYRMILKNERDKAFLSINEISQEINTIKGEVEFGRPTRNRPQNELQSFEFQGSFGGKEELSERFKKEEGLHKKASQSRLHLPKISFDSVLDLQKSESFVTRCQKLTKIEKQSQKKLKQQKPDTKRQVSANQSRKNSSSSFLSPPRSSKNSNSKSPCTSPNNKKTSTGGKRSTSQKRMRSPFVETNVTRLPKLNLSCLVNQASSSNNVTMDRAIDSNRAVAFAYYTRRLMQVGWRSFFNYRLEEANKRFYQRLCRQKHNKHLMKRALKGFCNNQKLHSGHAFVKRKATGLYQFKLGQKFLKLWHSELYQTMNEKLKLNDVALIMDSQRKRQILRAWRNQIFKMQLKDIQEKTAGHIFKQRYQKLGFVALKIVASFIVNRRRLESLARDHNRDRLLRKSITGFQVCKFIVLKSDEMAKIASRVFEFNLEKRAFQTMVGYCIRAQHYHRLVRCAQTYYQQNLLKSGVSLIKRHGQVSKQLKQEHDYVDKVYEKKLKTRLLKFIRASNKEFRGLARRVEAYMSERFELLVFQGLQSYAQRHCVSQRPCTPDHFFYYTFKFLLPLKQKSQFTFENPSIARLSKRSNYCRMRAKATVKLQKHVLAQIFTAWKKEHTSLKEYYINKNERAMKAVVARLKSKALANAQYKYILNEYFQQKKQLRIEKAFTGLKTNKFQCKFERLIIFKFKAMRDTGLQRKSLLKWALKYKRKAIRDSQNQVADEISVKRATEVYYRQWRTVFVKTVKVSSLRQQLKKSDVQKRTMNEQSHQQMRRKVLGKYFRVMLNTFYSLQGIELILQRYRQKLRARTLKKSICGLLQNQIVRQQKQYKNKQAFAQHFFRVCARSMAAWKWSMPEIKQKNRLFQIVEGERSIKTLSKAFHSFQVYMNYRRQKKQTDYFMGQAVAAVSTKRYFKHWRSQLQIRVGFKLLAYTLDKARVREFFDRVARKVQFEEQAERHMVMFNAFKLLEFTFKKGFEKNVQLKYTWAEDTQQMAEVTKSLTKRQYLRQWMEHLHHNQRELRMGQFCLIQIKNQVMKKYFTVLKTKYLSQRQNKLILRAYIQKIKTQVLSALKYHSRRGIKCRGIYSEYSSDSRRSVLTSFIRAWYQELWEVRTIAPSARKQDIRISKLALSNWKKYLLQKREQEANINRALTNHESRLLTVSLRALKDHKFSEERLQEIGEEIQTVDSLAIQKMYFRCLKEYYFKNQAKIQNRIMITHKLNKKATNNCWSSWFNQSGERLLRLRVVKGLNFVACKIEQRLALQKWVNFTLKCQELDVRADNVQTKKLLLKKRDALRKLRYFKTSRIVDRERTGGVQHYQVKRTLIRYFTMLRYSTQLILRRKQNKVRGRQFRIWQLLKKGLIAFIRKTQVAKTLKMLTLKLQDSLRQRYAPDVICRLNLNSVQNKEARIKQKLAIELHSARLYIKTWKSIVSYTNNEQDKNQKKNTAFSFCLYKSLKSTFEALAENAQYSQIIKSKRQALFMTVRQVDQSNQLMTAFSALALHRVQEQEKVGYIKLQLFLNSMQRVFDSFKFYRCFKKSLQERLDILVQHRAEVKQRDLMMVWARACNIKLQSKMLVRGREFNLKQIVIAALQRNKNIKQMVRLNLARKVVQYTQLSFRALQNNALQSKRLQIIETQIKLNGIITTMQKTFLGLRYQCILERNQRLMVDRTRQSLMIRSFSSWKYHIVREKTQKNYQQVRERKDQSFFFYYWMDLQRFLSSRRDALKQVIVKKDSQMKVNSFIHWKKQSYRASYLDLMRTHLVYPQEREIAKRCISSWRRYAKYRANKDTILRHIQQAKASYTARQCLRQWFEAATIDGGLAMNTRIFANKLEIVFQKKQQHKALVQIQQYGMRQDYLVENLEILRHTRRQSQLIEYFGSWRKRFEQRELDRAVVIQYSRKKLSDCFTVLAHHTQYSILDREMVEQTSQSLLNVTSMSTRLSLVQTLKSNYGLELNEKSLQAYYFYRLADVVDHNRQMRENEYKADSFHRYKLYLKYFYSILNYSTVNMEKQESSDRALSYLRYRFGVKVLKGFVLNTLKQRKEHNVQAFYHSKLCSQALVSLYGYYKDRQSRSALKTKMMRLLKKKCGKIFKAAFLRWRSEFHQKLYEHEAVYEFQKFRELKIKRMAFGYLAAVCDQQNKIRDMARRTEAYFRNRRRVKIQYIVLKTLKHNVKSRKYHKVVVVDRELQALRYNAFSLQLRHFKAWRKEVRLNKNRQMRSKMYAIFSAWKFYIKERGLLKKYLKEYSGLEKEPSLMSTIELKENFAKVSNAKRMFGDSMSSHGGTPNRRGEPLSPIENMSPQFSRVETDHRYQPQIIKDKKHYGQEEEEDLQATGYFSSVGSRLSNIMQNSENNRYLRY